ncbi:MAG TPA: hypothetical protein PK239_08565 [Chitinophagales bacterium]|nr:hypothetical protein [Chitinophagales bacterium]HRK27328.1 hypothetical protein [Chitinophagales bacterium]
MNYFAHFFIDHTHAQPHYTAGLILPDLVRNTNRNLRLPALILPNHSPTHPITHLNNGVKSHHAADSWFHKSVFFEQHLQTLKNLLYRQQFNSIVKYKYFVAHVLLEMMIDRLLINRFPELCTLFYQQLADTDEQVIAQYLELSGITTAQQTEPILVHFNRFYTSQYLFHYHQTEGLLFGLEQLYRRYVPVAFTPSDKQQLAVCVEAFEVILSANLPRLFPPNDI